MQSISQALYALLIAGLSALPAQAAQKVSVNELGADPTGTANSTKAFQEAVWRAGPGGVVTCEPGRYRLRDVLIFFSSLTLDCPAELFPANGATALLRVGYWEERPKPRYLNIRVHTLDGRKAPGLYCLDLLDVELSHFEIDRIVGCERGISIDPERSNVSDNRFLSSYWVNNDTALYLVPGNGWAQHNRFDVNFIARNELGIHLPDSNPLAALNWVETSMDLNERDAIIESPDGFYRFSFVTPSAPPIGGGLASSLVHILDSCCGQDKWHEPPSSFSSVENDFNGDGKADILWRNSKTGDTVIWLMDGGDKLASKLIGSPKLVWVIVKIEDYNGDGKADILWRHTRSGKTTVWLMDGFDKTSRPSIGTPNTSWKVQ